LDACKLVSVDAETVEEYVRDQVAKATIWKRHGQSKGEAEVLAAKRAQLTARRDEIADAFADGDLTRAQAHRANERLDVQEAEVDEQLRGIQPEFEKVEKYEPDDFPRQRADDLSQPAGLCIWSGFRSSKTDVHSISPNSAINRQV